MFHFLHTFHPFPILFSIGPIHIYWYGFFILLGALAAITVMLKLAPHYKIDKNKIFDLSFYLIIFGIIGARIYHIFLELPYYAAHPLDILKIWQGGLAIHGGIIAGIIVIYFFTKHATERLGLYGRGRASIIEKMWLLTAIIAPGLALAQAIGRWGNYFNQELFGLPTNLPWGIPIDAMNRPPEFFSSQYFHPTFLYESLGNFLIFIILISLHIWIIKKQKQNCIMYNVLCIMGYLTMYSVLRFFTEFIRVDKTPEFFGLRFPQIASILIILASIIFLLKNKKKYANINKALN